MSQRTND